ncbi:HEAT repeat domain-containing protein [Leptolyngbya sp. CCNP1308]|uniref:HEAT repeat domain-containing protein n=1 Tax=Leptolyngbya sp. CCNP1308 TaxID=3110255 RepID=UPI002B220013|nr:HEAT repeat domain-containing protein [Leptolyngbya sp. CCNP1308]MEA5447431.1 HEAT repeat domain-containing protein [Leptolyngbya sp. CCNP1308]
MLEGLAYLHYSCIYEQNDETTHICLKPLKGLVGLSLAFCAYITGSQSTEAAPTNLELGDPGADVEYLKERLREAWCLPQAIMNNDSYDEVTAAAVKSLQRQHGLLMSGVVDEQTAKAIEDGKMCYAPEDNAALKLGDEGEEVRLLQTQLNNWGFPLISQRLQVTGTFDSATQAALEEFEQFFGLKEDSIFDPLDSEVLWTPRALALLRHLDSKTFGEIAPALANLQPKEKSQIISTVAAQMKSGGKYTEPLASGADGSTLTYSATILGILKADAQDEVPTLIALLSSKDASVRASAAEALSHMGVNAQEAIPRLVTLSSNAGEEHNVRSKAIEALGYIGGDEQNRVIPALLTIAKDENNDEIFIRSGAIKAIGNVGADANQAVPDLLKIAEDENSGNTIRNTAIEALGNIKADAERVIPSLISLAKGKDNSDPTNSEEEMRKSMREGIRATAVSSIGKFGQDAGHAVRPLIELLNDKSESEYFAEKIIDSLIEIGPAAKAAVPTLITLFDDWEYSETNLDVQEQSINDEFSTISATGFCGEALSREKVALAIANIGPEAVPELIEALQHSDEKVRYGAAFALSKMPPTTTGDAVEPLQAVMKNRNENITIRWRAASTLQAMGSDTQDFFLQNNLEDLSTRREKRNDPSAFAFNEYIGQYVKYAGCGDDGQTIANCFLNRTCK